MNYLKNLIYILSITLLFACQSKFLTVHKIDVQQGNALDAEMIAKVKIGMSKEQVRYVLGSPLITDSFHPDRWDYIYLFTPGYGEQERKQLTLTFDRDDVININKRNINESEVASASSNDSKKNDSKEEKLSEKEEEELEDLEEQVDTLRGVLEENKNPGN